MSEHMREGHERCERIVAGAIQEDLLDVRTAQAREGRLDAYPVISWQRQIINVLDPNRSEAGHEGAPVDTTSDSRRSLAGQIVPKYQRLHTDFISGPFCGIPDLFCGADKDPFCGLPGLFCGADKDLIDRDPAIAGHDV